MVPLKSVPNKQKSTPPTKEKEDKKNTVTRRTPPNRYQHIFLGYCYSCNNFGHKAVHCKSYRKYNPKNVQRYKKNKNNAEKRNYNSFSPLQDYNVECHKCNNYGHKASECRFPMQSLKTSIPNNKDKNIWKEKHVEEKVTECKVALYAKNKKCQWYIDSGCSKHMTGDKKQISQSDKEGKRKCHIWR
jgi:hypothetical protein